MSLLKGKLFLIPIVILFTFAARAETWRTNYTTRFGATADVPAKWIVDPPPMNDDGRIFRSPNGRAQITVSGGFVIETKEEEIASRAEPGIGETITYQKRGPGWIIVSGTKGDRIFYEKWILTCHDTIWNDLRIEYPEADKPKYDALVTHVSASLRMGHNYACF